MTLDMIVTLLALAAVILLLAMLMRQRGSGGDSKTLVELRGQLAQLAAQSGELQKTVASQMQETEGRLGTRLEASLRDQNDRTNRCLLYTSPSPRDRSSSRMPSSA